MGDGVDKKVVRDFGKGKWRWGFLNDKIINKKNFVKIKNYNMTQMNNFCLSIYHSGFEDGVDAGVKADFKILLHEILQDTKGIGPVLRKNYGII